MAESQKHPFKETTMNFNATPLGNHAAFKNLVRDLLNIDPAALAQMDPATSSVAVGLHRFLTLTIDRAVGNLWAKDGGAIKLRSDAAARAVGYPDAATHNLSALLAFSLLYAPRAARASSYIPLCPADDSVLELPRKPRDPGTAAELAAVSTTLFKADAIQALRTPAPRPSQALSVCTLVQELLGIEPEAFVRASHPSRKKADRAFRRDPEGQTILGLALFVLSAIDSYSAAAAQRIDSISLLLVNDALYNGPANARHYNTVVLLIAGLLAEGNRDLRFLMPDAA